ncbi:MAG: ROK family transcriptional regulator [Pseudomonadota bacterium]
MSQDKERARQKKGRGSGPANVRAYNDRLVLSLLRQHGELSKAELTRATGLSAQSLSVIVERLTQVGLIDRGEKRRGKIGQPSTPYKLRADGAFSLGLKIGRRSFELLLIDFVGNIRRSLRQTCDYPTPEGLLTFFKRGYQGLVSDLVAADEPLVGLGVALPFQLWQWGEVLNAPESEMSAWRDFDVEKELSALTDLQIWICNDATAACAAELFFGKAVPSPNFLYLYVGTFIGGGIAINGALYEGPSGNAGAVGSMLVPSPDKPSDVVQLIEVASMNRLEQAMQASGETLETLEQSSSSWSQQEVFVAPWIQSMRMPLACASINALAAMDLGQVIVDGAMPSSIVERLVEDLSKAVGDLPMEGLSPFSINTGTHGALARALGAAGLPLMQQYGVDGDRLQRPI